MTQLRMLSSVLLLGSALLLSGSAAPPAGPGGVLEAMRDFLTAVEGNDLTYLRKAVTDERRDGRYGFDADGGIVKVEGEGWSFVDVTGSGEPITARTADQFLLSLTGEYGSKAGGRQLRIDIRSIQANCPSAECSYAVLEFDRVITLGDEETTVPMRATALLRHQKDQPHFKLFHWHASLRGPVTRR